MDPAAVTAVSLAIGLSMLNETDLWGRLSSHFGGVLLLIIAAFLRFPPGEVQLGNAGESVAVGAVVALCVTLIVAWPVQGRIAGSRHAVATSTIAAEATTSLLTLLAAGAAGVATAAYVAWPYGRWLLSRSDSVPGRPPASGSTVCPGVVEALWRESMRFSPVTVRSAGASGSMAWWSWERGEG